MNTSDDSSGLKRIRDHTVEFEPPDLCIVRFGEVLTADDGRAILAEEVRLAEEHGGIFVLADCRRIRSITAESRKLSAETSLPATLLGIAHFGVSFHLRVLAKLAFSLRRVARLPTVDGLFMSAEEADARAWIAERRRELKQNRG